MMLVSGTVAVLGIHPSFFLRRAMDHLKSSFASLQFLDHFTYFVQTNQVGDLPIGIAFWTAQDSYSP